MVEKYNVRGEPCLQKIQCHMEFSKAKWRGGALMDDQLALNN